RHFESATKIDKVEFFKVFSRIEENFGRIQKHFDIQDIRTCMHVDSVDMHFGIFYDSQDVRQLMDRNTELAIDMPHRNIGDSSGHHMRVNTNTNSSVWVFCSELFQNREVVYIDLYSHFCYHFHFFQRNSVGSKNDILGVKTCFKTQQYFLNGNRI